MRLRNEYLGVCAVLAGVMAAVSYAASTDSSNSVKPENLLGLPPLEIPADNPITREKVQLGQKLYNEKRFSSTGQVSCATCHDPAKGFTDSPLRTSKGVNGLTGTRNAPTTLNAAYNKVQFWDGRSPTLEEQALHPIINPVEMGLTDHEPVLKVVRTDDDYKRRFQAVFGKSGKQVTMKEVTMAIGAFERTLLSGGSRFDHWYFNNEPVLSKQEIRGYQTFIGNGRCVSCHVIEQTNALFTDSKFHNIGVGINHVAQNDI
jgi:cytochrome c peroxidase